MRLKCKAPKKKITASVASSTMTRRRRMAKTKTEMTMAKVTSSTTEWKFGEPHSEMY